MLSALIDPQVIVICCFTQTCIYPLCHVLLRMAVNDPPRALPALAKLHMVNCGQEKVGRCPANSPAGCIRWETWPRLYL